MRDSSVSEGGGRIDRLAEQRFDVLVVGGGIVGAGIARDAAQRGLSVALVEQYDLAFGTSSRSSRLLHGGIRYLGQGRLGLVREANREKKRLADLAPHLVEPMPFLFPTFRGGRWTRQQLGIGVKLYDLLCGGRNVGPSDTLTQSEVRTLLPSLTSPKLTGGVRYFDAQTHDARLVIDNLRAAARDGATIGNYLQFTGASRNREHWESSIVDTATNASFEIRSTVVVNATGPWSDRIPGSHTNLRPTKGVHLVVRRERFPVPNAVVMTEGKRILFAVPWGDRTYLGTTDTDYDGPLESPNCTEGDIACVLKVANRYFRDAELGSQDVVSAWSGLRPLVARQGGTPSDISRRHKIRMGERNWWDVTGGKLTTYRLMAEQTVDGLARQAGFSCGPCATRSTPLCEGLPTERISSVHPPPVTQAAVQHYCRHEWVHHLDDIMTRRTSWRHYVDDPDDTAVTVAGWMAEELSWSESRVAGEVEAYKAAGIRLLKNEN